MRWPPYFAPRRTPRPQLCTGSMSITNTIAPTWTRSVLSGVLRNDQEGTDALLPGGSAGLSSVHTTVNTLRFLQSASAITQYLTTSVCGVATRSAPDHARGDRRTRRCAECASRQKRARRLGQSERWPRASISRPRQSVFVAALAPEQSGLIPAPQSCGASGAPRRDGAFHARLCKLAVEAVRAGWAKSAVPFDAPKAAPCLP